jgi:tripeptidyl-peptidase-1
MVRICSILSTLAAVQAAKVEEPGFSSRPDWHIVSEAAPEDQHEVTFAVQQKNLDHLQEVLMSVSDPTSLNRGKYWTNSEINELTTDVDAVSKVEAFLTNAGVAFRRVDASGNYIKATTAVSQWESMFQTDIQKVGAVDGSRAPLLRAVSSVFMPDEISDSVAGIFRLSSLPPVMVSKPLPFENVTAQGFQAETPVTPSGLKTYYNVDETGGSSSQKQCVFESLGQYTSASDLSSFESQFQLPSKPIAEDIGKHVDDDQCKSNPNNCGEANLDVQYMIAMAPETPLTHWYVEDGETIFEDWIEQVAQTSNPPLVNSISYGGIEESVDKSVTSAFNTEAMKLGAQGVSVFVSSGDDGVANFQARSDATKCGYHPSFPASSPYVTAVGATQGGVNGGAEVACSSDTGGQITTGGGFSTKYTVPSYQTDAIQGYMASSAGKDAASGYTNGRGYPDIAMAGFNYQVVIAGRTVGVSGTSASSPVVAGFASLVNAKLADGSSSLKSVGFINPTLYKAGVSSFNDITSGNNKCAAKGGVFQRTVCCDQGFEATTGWDPLTGLGSVDYKKFEALFLSEDEDDVDPTVAPETTMVPETTIAPAPETTIAPAPETTIAPTPGTTVLPDPSLTLDQCHACFTMCAPCQACADGPSGSFVMGSCEKCWHCWNFGKDELKKDDNDMDKDCDVMHHSHDWDEHKVRCLTDSPKSSKVSQDCRPCWATFGDAMSDMMFV